MDLYKRASLKHEEEIKVLEKQNMKYSTEASVALSKYNNVCTYLII